MHCAARMRVKRYRLAVDQCHYVADGLVRCDPRLIVARRGVVFASLALLLLVAGTVLATPGMFGHGAGRALVLAVAFVALPVLLARHVQPDWKAGGRLLARLITGGLLLCLIYSAVQGQAFVMALFGRIGGAALCLIAGVALILDLRSQARA
jgi:hypothetical protein